MNLSIRLLGPMQVTLDGQSVACFETEKARALLAYLATEADRPHRRELLAEMLWPERPAGAAQANLRHTLAGLRRAIGDTAALQSSGPQAKPPALLVNRQAIQFNPASDAWVDVQAFLAALHPSPPPDQPLFPALEQAVELYRGPFLEDVAVTDSVSFEEWLRLTRGQLTRQALDALRRLAEWYELAGDYGRALMYARRGVELEPCDEPVQRQVMRLLAYTGQRNAALAQYEVCRRVLADELGVAPERETTELGRRIRDAELVRPSLRQERQPVPYVPAFMCEDAAVVKPPIFVGRERELARLGAFLEHALAGDGGIAFVTGGPGQGKTALLNEFTRRALAAHPDLLVARGDCNAISGIGDPYLPFRDVMALLTGDVEARWSAGAIGRDQARRLWGALPAAILALLANGSALIGAILPGEALIVRVGQALPGRADWLARLRTLAAQAGESAAALDQGFLFEQYAGMLHDLADRHPLVLLLDDLQWADSASLGLLFHLGRRLAAAGNRILLVGAYRPEEVAVGRAGACHPLEPVLLEFKRACGDVWVDLDEATQREGRGFVDALLDAERNRLGEDFRAALFRRTEGHPLFTIELLRTLQERGDLIPDVRADGAWVAGPALAWDALPGRVEAVIQARVDRLPTELREIIEIASVEGEQFTVQVVAAVQGGAERPLMRALQKLARLHRLVRERGEAQVGLLRAAHYQFSHILVREYVYQRLGREERRLLHGQVAAALASLYQEQPGEIAVQLAHHFEQAEDWSEAFRYYRLALDNAVRAHAHHEAISLYTRAIALAPKIILDAVALANLHRGRGRAHEISGNFERARADHETALQLSRSAGQRRGEWLALLDLAELWTSRDYSESRRCIDLALQIARELGDPAALAGSLNWVGNWHTNAENPAAALGYHQEALGIFERLEAREEVAHTLDRLGLTSLLRGDRTASVGYYDRAIPLFRELQDRAGLAAGLTGRGLAGSGAYATPTMASPSFPVDAQRDLEEALRIAREIASPAAEAWALWALSLWNTGQGQFGQAMAAVFDALHVASAIGHREWTAGARSILGALYVELLVPDAARPQLEQALALAQQLRSSHWIHHATAALAATWRLLGQPAQAQACLATVLTPDTGVDTIHKRTCWARRAELALAEGDFALALEITERLMATALGLSPGGVITWLWQLKGEALAALGRAEEAHALLLAAAEHTQASGERFHLWRIHASLGRLDWAMGRRPEAEQEFAAARASILDLTRSVPGQAFRDNFVQTACRMLSPGS